jgi:hypothetical protein
MLSPAANEKRVLNINSKKQANKQQVFEHRSNKQANKQLMFEHQKQYTSEQATGV